MLGIANYGAFCATVLLFLALPGPGTFALLTSTSKGGFRAGAAYLAWIGLKLIFAKPGAASPIRIEPRHYLRQAMFITLLNPKAIVFYMAFFPQFIDPTLQPGLLTFVTMAVTIAAITAAYCLTLCGFADLVAAKVRAHQRAGRLLERLAGVFLVGFGIRLGTQ